MPNLHLTKVAVGCRDLPALERRIAGRVEGEVVRVVTRMRPRRVEELIGGSLYWIVKHRMIACQEILRFDDRPDGRLDIVCSAALQIVPARSKRAHQGWRYLEVADAPKPGDNDDTGIGLLAPLLYGKLAALALL